MLLRDILYKSDNLIIQQLASGSNDVVIIHGSGHSVSVNENNKVTFSDPLFTLPHKTTDYGKCTVLTMYFPKCCQGLESAGKELAEYINNHLGAYNQVVLHGHSKCGCCFINLAQWLTRRVTIVAVSAPLNGTPVADLKAFSSRLGAIAKYFYLRIFSDHNVDRDICPSSKFIRNLAIDYAVKNHDCHIIVSKCGWSWNLIDLLLWLIDTVFDVNGDGIVPLESQIPKEPVHCYNMIIASHATSMRKSMSSIDSGK